MGLLVLVLGLILFLGSHAFTTLRGQRAAVIKAIGELASMPSREEIFAKLLFVINAPAQRLATAVNAVGRNLAVAIDQGVKENKFKGV